MALPESNIDIFLSTYMTTTGKFSSPRAPMQVLLNKYSKFGFLLQGFTWPVNCQATKIQLAATTWRPMNVSSAWSAVVVNATIKKIFNKTPDFRHRDQAESSHRNHIMLPNGNPERFIRRSCCLQLTFANPAKGCWDRLEAEFIVLLGSLTLQSPGATPFPCLITIAYNRFLPRRLAIKLFESTLKGFAGALPWPFHN